MLAGIGAIDDVRRAPRPRRASASSRAMSSGGASGRAIGVVQRLAERPDRRGMGKASQRTEQAEHVRAADGEERPRVAPADRLGTVGDQQPAGLHQAHPVAQARLVHVGRGDDDRQPLVAQPAEQVPELLPRDRVHAGGGLVEEQDLGPVHQRAAERELLLHAAGERAGAAVGELLELDPDRRDGLPRLRHRGVEERGEERQVLRDAEVGIEREASGHVADPGPQVPQVLHHVASQHPGGAGVRQQQGHEDPEQRGLAGAVGTDHAVELARRRRRTRRPAAPRRRRTGGRAPGPRPRGRRSFATTPPRRPRASARPASRSGAGLPRWRR